MGHDTRTALVGMVVLSDSDQGPKAWNLFPGQPVFPLSALTKEALDGRMGREE